MQRLYSAKNLPWTNDVITVLGVQITNDDDVMKLLKINYEPVIEQSKQIMSKWAHRHLSLDGKIEILNTAVASLFVYKMSVLPPLPDGYAE